MAKGMGYQEDEVRRYGVLGAGCSVLGEYFRNHLLGRVRGGFQAKVQNANRK